MSQVKHLGIIMDGNRRFSKRLMQQPWKGHDWGRKKLEEVLQWCKEAGVTELTVYALSIQNLNRPQQELSYLKKLFLTFAQDLIDKKDEAAEKDVRIIFIGRRDVLGSEVEKMISQVEEVTKDNSQYLLRVALGYGGREEIVDAINALVRDVQAGVIDGEVSEATLSSYLYTSSEPDLIIRTGGDHRTSNFLLWQSPYSEWCFVDELWPEFSKETFLTCLNDFSSRERRFGR